jgi:hypothetical protein
VRIGSGVAVACPSTSQCPAVGPVYLSDCTPSFSRCAIVEPGELTFDPTELTVPQLIPLSKSLGRSS